MLSFSLIGAVRNTLVPSSVRDSSSEFRKASAISCVFEVKARILLNRKNIERSIPVVKIESNTKYPGVLVLHLYILCREYEVSMGPEKENDGSKCVSSDNIKVQFMIMCESRVNFQHSVLK